MTNIRPVAIAGRQRVHGLALPCLYQLEILDIAAFLVPVTRFIEISLVGRLFLTDVLLACILLLLLPARGKRLRERLPLTFLLLALLWLSGQLAADIVRQAEFRDYARGWSKILFTMINFSALYLMLVGNRRRLILYAGGLAAGGLATYLFNPSVFAEGLPWKFGYGESVTWLMALLATLLAVNGKTGLYAACTVLASSAVLNLSMGFRSLGGICFLSSCYLFLLARWGDGLAKGGGLRRILVVGGALAISGALVYAAYGHAARSGWLGENELGKFESQLLGKYGLLLGGRGEVLAAGRAIYDSPLLGHGSWAKNYDYSYFYYELMRRSGYVVEGEVEDGLIPSHSHLLGAWVEAGLAGALFWIWVLSLPARVMFGVYGKVFRLAPLAVLFALLLIWDVLFSPYGAAQRFVTPYYVVFMMSCLCVKHPGGVD